MDEYERKFDETRFHDAVYRSSKGERSFLYREDLLEPLRVCALSYLGEMKGKKLLFYGSGLQWGLANRFYQQGADVFMIDISAAATEFLEAKIRKENQSDRIRPIRMDCELLSFADDTFDLVFGNAIIHHLNISKAVGELYRVMKSGARAAFIEPLGMNPLITLYRTLTPSQRTMYEHPLKEADWIVFENKFPHTRHLDFTLCSLVPVIWNAFADRVGIFTIGVARFRLVDEYLIERFPRLSRYCWNTVIQVQK